MQVEIKNCNNINTASIEIKKNKLNIKYGINGTGKSTIAKAIEQKIEGDDLLKLKPYGSVDTITPEVIGIDELHSITVYNEDYISKYLFLPNGDNLHKDAFEVFIKPNDYEEKVESISNDLEILKNIAINDENINKIINQIPEFDKIFKTTINKTTGKITIKKLALGKALYEGSKIVNIPNSLELFTDFIVSKNRVNWYKWRDTGVDFVINNKCPYCSKILNDEYSSINDELKNIFDTKNVDSILKMENIIDNISDSLTDETYETLKNIISSAEPINDSNQEKMLDFYIRLKKIYLKINSIYQLDYSGLSNINNLTETISNLRFNLEDFEGLFSESLSQIILNINKKVDELLESVEELKSKVEELKNEIINYSNTNIKRINDFLDSVGMNYEVNVENDKLLLYCKNSTIKVDVIEHLSYGERNSFALSLFLFDCLHNNPDLIVLDDPVSSFDFNKKYAIMHYLFGELNAENLRDKTVLLLTHDLEPVIDMIKIKGRKYKNANAFYLENINGNVVEKSITENDINSIIDITKEKYSDSNLNIINRLVHLRRYYELQHNKNMEYSMISSLFHGQNIPTYNYGKDQFSQQDCNATQSSIQELISGFDYNSLLAILKNKDAIKQLYNETTNSYEKIEIFRMIYHIYRDDFPVMPVVAKFIDEAFHIENTYIFQLDPYAYNIVPNYIIKICDSMVSRFNS